jgi:Undecaprenyl-phosphate glucose phosphotransferase
MNTIASTNGKINDSFIIERQCRRRLSPVVIRDLILLIEAALVACDLLLVHVAYYLVVLDASPAEAWYGFMAATMGLSFLAFKRADRNASPAFASSFRHSFLGSLRATLAAAAVLLVVLFLMRAQLEVSRGWFVLGLAATLGVTGVFDALVSYQLLQWRSSAASNPMVQRVAMVGDVDMCRDVMDSLSPDASKSLELVGFYPAKRGSAVAGGPAAGDFEDLIELIKQRQVDEVLIVLPDDAEASMTQAIEQLVAYPVDINLCLGRLGRAVANVACCGNSYGLLLLPLVRHPISHWGGVAKRVLDIVLSALGLIVLAPLLLLVALAIRLDSPGPILFRQLRQGYSQEVFEIWKFRTMYCDTDPPSGRFSQAKRNDRRVTRVGQLLRRTSFDELPQLVNVLRGDMSLVGPRPHPLPLNDRFMSETAFYPARHRVLPGITGLAQINGYRGETDTEEKIIGRLRHDLHYIRNWSLWLDFKILFLTIIYGFVHRNAY